MKDRRKTSPAVDKVLRMLRKQPEVEKVTLGPNLPKKGRASKTRAKIIDIASGLKVTISSAGSVQDVFVKTTHRQPTARAIAQTIR